MDDLHEEQLLVVNVLAQGHRRRGLLVPLAHHLRDVVLLLQHAHRLVVRELNDGKVVQVVQEPHLLPDHPHQLRGRGPLPDHELLARAVGEVHLHEILHVHVPRLRQDLLAVHHVLDDRHPRLGAVAVLRGQLQDAPGRADGELVAAHAADPGHVVRLLAHDCVLQVDLALQQAAVGARVIQQPRPVQHEVPVEPALRELGLLLQPPLLDADRAGPAADVPRLGLGAVDLRRPVPHGVLRLGGEHDVVQLVLRAASVHHDLEHEVEPLQHQVLSVHRKPGDRELAVPDRDLPHQLVVGRVREHGDAVLGQHAVHRFPAGDGQHAPGRQGEGARERVHQRGAAEGAERQPALLARVDPFQRVLRERPLLVDGDHPGEEVRLVRRGELVEVPVLPDREAANLLHLVVRPDERGPDVEGRRPLDVDRVDGLPLVVVEEDREALEVQDRVAQHPLLPLEVPHPPLPADPLPLGRRDLRRLQQVLLEPGAHALHVAHPPLQGALAVRAEVDLVVARVEVHAPPRRRPEPGLQRGPGGVGEVEAAVGAEDDQPLLLGTALVREEGQLLVFEHEVELRPALCVAVVLVEPPHPHQDPRPVGVRGAAVLPALLDPRHPVRPVLQGRRGEEDIVPPGRDAERLGVDVVRDHQVVHQLHLAVLQPELRVDVGALDARVAQEAAGHQDAVPDPVQRV